MEKHTKSDLTNADKEFLKTRDILRLQHALGHKHIRSTFNYAVRKKLLSKPSEEAKA